MSLRDPIPAYNAATNVEAHLVCHTLIEAEINAMVVEDTSVVGQWFGGLMPEIHKPQVWIDRGDMHRAKTVLEEYERQAAERREMIPQGEPISVMCEECGRPSIFPASQKGTLQTCPHCDAYIDVDDIPWAELDDPAGNESISNEPENE